jgi:Zn-finger nucleic acid-binding protein
VKTLPESIRCVNGCGNLTIDKHEKLTKRERISLILMGFTLIIITVIFTGLALAYDFTQDDCGDGEEIPAYWGNFGFEDCSDFSMNLDHFFPSEVYAYGFFFIIVISFLLILGGIIGGNAIEYFYCDKCGGKLLDSKTLRTKLGHQSNHEIALIIENLLEDCDYGERECPTCEAKMKVLDLGYKIDIDYPYLPTMTGERNIELDGCLECSHIWFDKSEFRKFREAKTKSLKLN